MSLWIYIAWFLVICVEIFRNWSLIEVKKRRPTYWWSTIIRIVAGSFFWMIIRVVADVPPDRYYAIPIMMFFTSWFVFDYGLNLARKRHPLYYLNPNGSWLDRMQCKYPDAQPWFFWKLVLAMGSVSLCEYGLNAVL